VTLWTTSFVRRLLATPGGDHVEALEVERPGQTVRIGAKVVVVSCGAVNSAALLLRSAGPGCPDGLANSSGLVGRRYMAHHATMLSAFDRRQVNETVFQKTVAINDFYLAGPTTPYPLGQIQSQGRTQAVVLKAESPWYGRWIPLEAWAWWAKSAVDWLAMSEDLPADENRVTVDRDGAIHLHYQPNNGVAHRELVRRTKRLLSELGFVVITHSLGTRNTTHQCGTLCFGRDPRRSVLDPFCRAHDVDNLFVVDASFFPSSAAVNPGLTIVAQALRVADHIKETALRIRDVPAFAAEGEHGR
jgi:choline dehydrogenase-like flavoprotein